MGTLAPKGDPSSHGGHGSRQPSLPKQRNTADSERSALRFVDDPARIQDADVGRERGIVKRGVLQHQRR